MPPVLLRPPVLVCPRGCGHRALGAATVAETGAPVGGGAAVLHYCRNLYGLAVPMVPEGTRADARAVEREDYAGAEQGLRYDDHGRPIMAVEVERNEGTDRAVFVPAANGRAD